MHWRIAEGIHSTFFHFVRCIPSRGVQSPSGEEIRDSLGRRVFSLRDTLFVSVLLRVNSSPLFNERKKEKEKLFDNVGVKNVGSVDKRRKRAEKICPFKIIILKTKHQKKVGRGGWSARTHPCFVP